MEINKCPNCSGKLELSVGQKKLICKFCGSEFTVDKDTKDTIEEGFAEKDWFIYDWDYEGMMNVPKLSSCVSSFLRAINEFGTSAAIEEYMKGYLMNYPELSAPGINESKMSGIKARIAGKLTSDERIILYDDDGLFIHGKTGVVITNKRTLIVEKKNIIDLPHRSVPYLYFEFSFGVPGIKLGDENVNNIGIFNSHFDLEGTVAALICAFSFEENPKRPKIRLLSHF